MLAKQEISQKTLKVKWLTLNALLVIMVRGTHKSVAQIPGPDGKCMEFGLKPFREEIEDGKD